MSSQPPADLRPELDPTHLAVSRWPVDWRPPTVPTGFSALGGDPLSAELRLGARQITPDRPTCAFGGSSEAAWFGSTADTESIDDEQRAVESSGAGGYATGDPDRRDVEAIEVRSPEGDVGGKLHR